MYYSGIIILTLVSGSWGEITPSYAQNLLNIKWCSAMLSDLCSGITSDSWLPGLDFRRLYLVYGNKVNQVQIKCLNSCTSFSLIPISNFLRKLYIFPNFSIYVINSILEFFGPPTLYLFILVTFDVSHSHRYEMLSC